MTPIYFDNAATTFPKPPQVAQAVLRYLTESGANINRGSYGRAYETEELKGFLREAGFTNIRAFGDCRMGAPRESEERIYFCANRGKD